MEDCENQIKLYRAAFQPLKKQRDFNIMSTHVPGLIPLVRMGYSYTKGLIKKDVEQKTFLKQFWKETKEDIQKERMTLPNFKKTIFRLAMLVTSGQEKSRYFRSSSLLKFYESGNWKDLRKYSQESMFDVNSFPFCFEAILYYPPGEISLEAFCAAYLEDDVPLGLSAFAQSGKGPHGNFVDDSASLLAHDFVHWDSLAGVFNENLKAWSLARSLMKKCWEFESPPSAFNKVGIFLLLHEFNHDLIENGQPPSQHEMFNHWVKEAQEEANDTKNPATIAFFSALIDVPDSPFKIAGLEVMLDETKVTSLEKDIFQFDVIMDFGLPENNGERFIGVGEGTGKAYVQFSSTDSPYYESVTLQKLTDIVLKPVGPSGSSHFDVNKISQKLTSLSSSRIGNSRYSTQEINIVDWENLTRVAYGQSPLLPQVSFDETINKLLNFLTEFYEKHKNLFPKEREH